MRFYGSEIIYVVVRRAAVHRMLVQEGRAVSHGEAYDAMVARGDPVEYGRLGHDLRIVGRPEGSGPTRWSGLLECQCGARGALRGDPKLPNRRPLQIAMKGEMSYDWQGGCPA